MDWRIRYGHIGRKYDWNVDTEGATLVKMALIMVRFLRVALSVFVLPFLASWIAASYAKTSPELGISTIVYLLVVVMVQLESIRRKLNAKL